VTAPPLQGEARMDSLVRDNIIRLRIAANLTRRELGHKIGSSQDVISRIEEPDHERKLLPTTLTLMRIADGLDVDLVKFFLPEKGYRYRDPV
jgi:transcriptional regulator with XRE-family HTH domain